MSADDMRPNEMTGGEALARALIAHGAGPIFGMGGFQLLPFYDAARRLGLDHHLINDERAGVFAADGYAKVSGRVGLADATLGPGATNLVTGLVEALNAGSPLVVITGNAHRDFAGRNMTQEADQTAILRPAVKALLRVEAVHRIPELVARAFAIATSGRPGPVVLDIPEDVAHATHPFAEDAFEADPATASIPSLRCAPDPAALARAAEILAAAERPLILAGGGIHLSGAHAALARLAEGHSIPVAHTMTGKGAIACTSPLSAGLFGRYDRIANGLIADADCLLAIGCKLGEIATRRYTLPAPGRTLIHLDIVAEEIGRTYRPSVRLWSDARAGLEALAAALPPAPDRTAWRAEIPRRMARWREETAARTGSDESPVHMARLVAEIRAALPDDGILVADGGFAAHWAALLFDTRRPGRFFVPDRGFASIGYGLPGAIGAQLARPEACVVGLTGDGGFNMMLGEIETARRMKLPVVIVVVNNAASGYVKALQHLMYGEGAYQSADLAETDYAAIARSMGCGGHRVAHPAELAPAFAAAFATRDRPTVIDVVVTRDPARMLPAVDSRTIRARKGDRVA
jgi:acetolactate synthase-1/2/3 large subunit